MRRATGLTWRKLCWGHEEFGQAAEALEDAQKVFSRSAQIELALGVAFYGQRRFPDAVAILRTIELAPCGPALCVSG